MTDSGRLPGREPNLNPPGDRLDSWKEIASYLKRSVRTVTRWEQDEALPVHRHLHNKTGTVYAYKAELDAWSTSRGSQLDGKPVALSSPGEHRLRPMGMVAAVAGALTIAGIVAFAVRSTAPAIRSSLIPLTTYQGIEGPPSLSPDGNQVAFERAGDIFVKQVDGEAVAQLTNSTADERAPAWSPDGRQIAFVRDGDGIFLLSPLARGERKIGDTRAPPLLKTMAWTPDSRALIISEMTSSICASLFRISVATGEKTRLTFPPEPSIGDGWPAVSPDGRVLAFARYSQDASANIYLMPMIGGEPRRVTADKASIVGLAWTPEGREVVFSSDRDGVSRLLRAPATSVSPGSASVVESSGDQARFPSISRPVVKAPVRLAYQRFEELFDIRRVELVGPGRPLNTLKPSTAFLASTRSEDHPQFSPDGRKIAFVSNRSGTWEIWLGDSDGSNLVRLTSMGGPKVIGPRWSPDGKRLAFYATTGNAGTYSAYVIGAEGGSPSRLSRDDKELEALPNWSHDGHWIYCASGRSGTLEIWKTPVDGGGEPVQITKGGGADASESPDGRFVYYAKVPEMGLGLWRVPVGGGEEVRVLDSVSFGYWAVAPQGIYFIDFSVANQARWPVKFMAFRDRAVTEIGTVEASVSRTNNPGFAVSPDGRWLLYSSLERTEADLMLIANFH
jgi:Tol biopolymer transport system component